MTQEMRARVCHPDKASNASGGTWLLASGQLRASETGSGFEIAQRSFSDVVPEGVLLPDFTSASQGKSGAAHYHQYNDSRRRTDNTIWKTPSRRINANTSPYLFSIASREEVWTKDSHRLCAAMISTQPETPMKIGMRTVKRGNFVSDPT
jgi:hypothetical protein